MNALETLKARNLDLEKQIVTASSTQSALTSQITALTTEVDSLKAALEKHEDNILAITTERDALKATVVESTAKIAELSAKEQDIQKRASAIAIHTMAGVGQPPVATTATQDNPPKIDPKLTGRDRVEAAITARLHEIGAQTRKR